MKGSCIINMAFVDRRKGSNWFIGGQIRLRKAMQQYTNSDYFFYNSEEEVGAPDHFSEPYAFKLYAIQRALEEGYKYIFWADSSIYPIKSMKPVWEVIKNKGYFFVLNGFNAGEWTSDNALSLMGMNRETALKIQSVYGGVFGIDVLNPQVEKFLKELAVLQTKGAYRGDWTNERHQVSSDDRVKGHRHDQAVMSLLLHQMGMTDYTEGLLQPWHMADEKTVLIYKRFL